VPKQLERVAGIAARNADATEQQMMDLCCGVWCGTHGAAMAFHLAGGGSGPMSGY
jgi:hypothetical protein